MEAHPYRPAPDVSGAIQASLQEAMRQTELKARNTERQLAEALAENTKLLRENVRLTELAGRMPVVTQLWEYFTATHEGMNCSNTSKHMNKFGAEGWELVSSTDSHAFFKRPLVTKPE